VSQLGPEYVRGVIEAFLRSPANDLGMPLPEKAWGAPLLGFARGDDPLFLELKAHIGDFYLTPIEVFAAAFPGSKARSEELSVIGWILPQTARTREDNRRQSRYPAERWARSKWHGEQVNVALRETVVAALSAAGSTGVAPVLTAQFREESSAIWGRASTWSERHTAHVCGLGTFGLSDGLITVAGKAHRCGSVVTDLLSPPTSRPYSRRHEFCLFFARGDCLECAERCPVGAISEAGHDKEACAAYLAHLSEDYVPASFGFTTGVCGLCQTGVPCEAGIPPQIEARPQ
jgi:hypothetical protein